MTGEGDIRKNRKFFSTYPAAIDEGIEFFRGKLDILRKPGKISTQKAGGVRNLFTWKKAVTAYTNAPAVLAAGQFCRAAIAELEAMRLNPDPDLTRIEALKKGVPDHTVMTEIGGEKDLEKFEDPAAGLFPTDEFHDWSMKKLNEKFQKVMHGGR